MAAIHPIPVIIGRDGFARKRTGSFATFLAISGMAANDPIADYNRTAKHGHMFEKRILSIALIAFACLSGCSEGKRPFRMVQFCLADASEIPEFTSYMNEIAQEYQMHFTDRSGQTGSELKALAADNENVPVNGRHVNIGAEFGDDFSFGAGNLGMPDGQIVIGFNGSSETVARQFADDVVNRLSKRWRIHEVPHERGAFPLDDC